MKVFVSLALFVAVAFAEPPSSAYGPPQQQKQQQPQGQRYFFARQQQAPTAAPAPYAPSGWKPDGPAFDLPEPTHASQAVQVDNSYGPPQTTPNNQYIPSKPQFASRRPQSQTVGALRQQQFNRFEKQTQGRVNPAPRPHEQYNAPQTQYGGPEPTTNYPETPETPEYDEPTTVIGLPDAEPEPLDSRRELEDEYENGVQNRQQQPQQHESGQYYVALPDGRLQRVRYVSRQDLEAMRYVAKIRAENVEPLRGQIYAYAPLQKLEVQPGSLQVAPVTSGLVTNGLSVTSVESKPQKLVAPKVDIKPLTQLQYQHDNQARVAPANSAFAAYTEYQAPANLAEERFILAFP